MNEPFAPTDAQLELRTRRIDLAHEHDFTLGPICVRPCLRKLVGPDGETMLEPKVMQVLVALAAPVGTILSRDDLIERCWEGRIVGDTSINRVISLLRSGLKNVGGDAAQVENVPKVGYRLTLQEGLDAAPDEASEPTASAPEEANAPVRRRVPLLIAAGLAAMLAIVAALYALWPSPAQAPVQTIRVAMLPMKAGEGVDPLYARGLEEELRTQLARVGRMEVTSSESARQLFEQGLSPDEICRRLGADFAWLGTLNVEADRVTLSARLIEAETKDDVFRESLTSSPDAAQTLPLRTARAITTALGRPVSQRISQTPVSASDFSLYLTALGLMKTRGDEQRRAALDILEQVTEQNPDFADGWAGLAKAWFLLPAESEEQKMVFRERAGEFAQKAITLDPDSVDAIKVLGMLEGTEPSRRLALLKRATELDPGDPEAWFWRSLTQEEFMLRSENPVASAARVVDIDPLWPVSWLSSNVATNFGRLDEARSMEESIALAAVTPSQRLLAQARLALLDGDISRMVALTREAQNTQTQAERLFGSKMSMHFAERLLNLPQSGEYSEADDLSDMSDMMMQRVFDGDLPSRRELAQNGAAGADFWANGKLVDTSIPLFLAAGREAELAEYYDTAFQSHADYLDFAAQGGHPHSFIPSISPYLALAFQRLGRDEDAAAHLASAQQEVERWREADTGAFSAILYDLNLAAAQNDTARALALVRQLRDFGWPYTMGHSEPGALSLLRDDPLYARLREDTQIREVLEPIRANLARERDEVLALGAG